MKLFTKKEIAPLLVILSMVVVSVGFWSATCLPEQIPSHWNASGKVDDYTSKEFALIFYPVLALGLYLLMTLLPAIDPLKKNYQKFAKPYFFIRLILVLFLAGLYFFTIAFAFGFHIDIRFFIIPLLSLLFIGLGSVMPKIKRNYFVGIRTPWTLQNDEVWQKTHQFGGKAMMLGGALSVLSIFAGEFAIWVFLGIVIVASFAPMGYSYWLYRKLGLFKK